MSSSGAVKGRIQVIRRGPVLLTLALAAIAVGGPGCRQSAPKADSPSGLDEWVNDQSRRGDGGAVAETSTTAGSDAAVPDAAEPPPIPCTLADDGAPCRTSQGEPGQAKCVASQLQCWVCQPGEQRTASCGCGDLERTDTCQPNGRWRAGACDSCTQDPAPVPCGFCGERDPASGQCIGGGECKPGWVRFKRCDTCPNPDGCSPSSCIGEKWECSDACTWVKTESCGIRGAKCDGEAEKVERCGVCGDVRVPCDGCFWVPPETCGEQQECYPNTTRTVDCFAQGCAEGLRSSISCNADCKWNAPTACFGCTEGWHTEQRDCVYRKPQCGRETFKYYCTVPAPANSCDVPLGTKGSYSVVTACPPIECYPGQERGQYCTRDDGTGGRSTMRCGDDCTWPAAFGACTAVTDSCVPGTTTSQEIDCGCGRSYTRTRTCNETGTGWVLNETGREACPPCQPGDSQALGCAAGGTCGSQTKSCNPQCQWETSSCTPSAGACHDGETRQGSCQGRCGGGTATFHCVGCRWVQSTECYPSEEPECAPGEMRQTLCQGSLPGCPLREDFCGSSCQWVQGTCPPCS